MEILCDRQNMRGVSTLNSDQDLRFGPLVYGSTLPLSVGIVDNITAPSGSRIWQPIDVSTGTLKAAVGRGFALPVAGSFRLISGVNQTSGPLVTGKTYLVLTYLSGDDFTNVGGSNTSGTIFTSSGTAPTTWSNASILQDVTAEIAFDCWSTAVASALNALPSIAAAGGVTVSGDSGYFTVSFVNAGPQSQIYGDPANLAPSSLVDAGTLIDGSTDPVIREVQTLQIVQDVGAFVNLTTASASAAVTIDPVQTGGAGVNAQYRVSISPTPYDGSLTLILAGRETAFLAYNAGASDVVAALETLTQKSGLLVSGRRYKITAFVTGDDFTNLGAGSNATGIVFTATSTTPTTWTHSSSLSPVGAGNVQAIQETTSQWLIQFVGDMAGVDMGTMTGNATGILVVPEKSGTLDLRTSGCALILGQADNASVIFEIQYTPSGGTPQTVYRQSQTLIMPAIKPASGTPTPRDQFYDKAAIDAMLAAITTWIVSSGGIADLTSGQQAQIVEGTGVITTDGKRWAYKGAGSKVLEASYVQIADITPTLADISDMSANARTLNAAADFAAMAALLPLLSNDGGNLSVDSGTLFALNFSDGTNLFSSLFDGTGGYVAYATSATYATYDSSGTNLLSSLFDGSGGNAAYAAYASWAGSAHDAAYADSSGTQSLPSLFDGTGGNVAYATNAGYATYDGGGHLLSDLFDGSGGNVAVAQSIPTGFDLGTINPQWGEGTLMGDFFLSWYDISSGSLTASSFGIPDLSAYSSLFDGTGGNVANATSAGNVTLTDFTFPAFYIGTVPYYALDTGGVLTFSTTAP